MKKVIILLISQLMLINATAEVIWTSSGRKHRLHKALVKIEDNQSFSVHGDTSHSDHDKFYENAVYFSSKNQVSEAFENVKVAVRKGIPIERFIAGPRDYFSALYSSESYQDYVKTHFNTNKRVIHGPMLGAVSHQGFSVWVRASESSQFYFEVSESENMSALLRSDTVQISSVNDYTGVAKISNLMPNKKYYYRVRVGNDIQGPYVLTTYPEVKERKNFSIAFGGGAGYNPFGASENLEKIWEVIENKKPYAMFMMGDNVYTDSPERPNIQRATYYRRQSRPEWRKLVRNIPIYSVWDDHDFAINDYDDNTPDINNPSWKLDVLDIFKEQWVNPYYGGDSKGVWFDLRIGLVDFYFLDVRTHRVHGNKTMLGNAQKAWLKEKLKSSDAIFKVICTAVPMAQNVKPGSKDTWDGYDEERAEILSFIGDNEIAGVFLVAADRHRSDHWVWTDPNVSYPMHEFMSSRLSNVHTHSVLSNAEYGYNEKTSFGMLEFDVESESPKVTYSIWNFDNQKKYTYDLLRSSLGNPHVFDTVSLAIVEPRTVQNVRRPLTLVFENSKTVLYEVPRAFIESSSPVIIEIKDLKGKVVNRYQVESSKSTIIYLGKMQKQHQKGSYIVQIRKGEHTVSKRISL